MTTEDCLLQKNLLIEENYGLVYHMANLRYRNDNELDYDEKVGIGSVALVKAVQSYDPNKNKKLDAYICRCVENALKNAFRNTRKYAHDTSVDEYAFDESVKVRVIDLMTGEESPEEDVIDGIAHNAVYIGVHEAIDKLDEHGQFIIKSYFGIGCEPLGQQQIAEIVGCSQMSISRSVKRYTEQLKSLIDGDLIHYL